MSDNIRVLRVIEYRGPRVEVESQVERSLHGTKRLPNGVIISAATVGNYPEMIDNPIPEEVTFGSPSGSSFDLCKCGHPKHPTGLCRGQNSSGGLCECIISFAD